MTTITGNLFTLLGAAVPNSFVRFNLRGCNGSQPRVSGTALIGMSFDLTPDSSGNITGSAYANDKIETTLTPGGFPTWYGVVVFTNGIPGPETGYSLVDGVAFNLNSATPISTIPVIPAPTGDTTYARLDGGNTPFTALIQFAQGLRIAIAKVMGWADVAFSRISAGVMALGTGADQDASGQLNAGKFQAGTAFQTSTANPATAEIIRLATTDGIGWRNSVNGGNVALKKTQGTSGSIPADSLDATQFGAVEAIILIVNGNATGSNQVLKLLNTAASGHNWNVGEIFAVGDLALRDTTQTGNSAFVFRISTTTTSANATFNNNNTAARVYTLPDATDTLVGKATTDTLTNKTLGGTTPFNRFRANQGTALVSGDFSFSAGWGNTASIGSIGGTDGAFTVSVTSNGTGQSGNPTVTVTFHDGTWTTAPIVVITGNNTAPQSAWVLSTVSATSAVFVYTNVPVAGNVYMLDVICIGK